MRYVSFCSLLILVGFVAALANGCQSQQDTNYDDAMARMKHPIDCSTAEGDIRVLEREKSHTEDQIAAGVSSITPIGLVVGLAQGKTDQNFKVSTGEYNRMIDDRIREIKEHCGLD